MNHTRILQSMAALLTAACGAALMVLSVAVSHGWVLHHFLPDFSVSPHAVMVRQIVLRAGMFAFGAVALARALPAVRGTPVLRSRISLGQSLRVGLAVLLAVAVSEAVLRTAFAGLFDELVRRHPPRVVDQVLGWTNQPGDVDRVVADGRAVVYTMDAFGNRVAGQGASPNPEQPAIVLSGESFAIGYGLPWQDTIAASLETLSKTQVADVAVVGYSLSQSFLRLKQQLPRFAHPVAVVSFFVPSVFKKMLDRNRPQLTPSLTWRPSQNPWRLTMAVHWLVPYDSTGEIDRAVATARAVLRETDAMARAQGARAVIVVPQFMPEPPGETYVRRRVLDEGGLSYVLVPMPADWRLSDGHPDPRGAQAIAEALARELTRTGNHAR
jgi:hypothetical protein